MILLHAFAQKLRNGAENPKNYPYWKELISMIDEPIVQVGIEWETRLVDDFRTNLSLDQLRQLLKECTTFISVDSFFHHLAWKEGKEGIVIWGKSDPLIFWHGLHYNLVNREHLRKNQFGIWEDEPYDPSVFVKPEEVIKVLWSIK